MCQIFGNKKVKHTVINKNFVDIFISLIICFFEFSDLGHSRDLFRTRPKFCNGVFL